MDKTEVSYAWYLTPIADYKCSQFSKQNLVYICRVLGRTDKQQKLCVHAWLQLCCSVSGMIFTQSKGVGLSCFHSHCYLFLCFLSGFFFSLPPAACWVWPFNLHCGNPFLHCITHPPLFDDPNCSSEIWGVSMGVYGVWVIQLASGKRRRQKRQLPNFLCDTDSVTSNRERVEKWQIQVFTWLTLLYHISAQK